MLYKTSIKSTFNSNYRINRLHTSALRVLHGDSTSAFEELLIKSEEIAIHCSNLQKLMTEICECTKYSNLPILSEAFTTKEINYDLRITNLLQVPKIKSSTYGQRSLPYRGSVLWNTLSDSI